MSHVIHYTHCPACGEAGIKEVLRATDHTVSQKEFSIWECSACTIRFTQDVPDEEAIGSYYKSEEYISHTNTSKGLVNKLYQWVRSYTLKQKRKLVTKKSGIKKGALLDFGCGTGAFINEMKDNGWLATGLEPDPGARETGEKLYGIKLQSTTEFYRLPPAQFDAITLWHVLEHVHDLSACLRQLRFLLKDNGKLIIAVPNYTSKDAAVYRQYWAGYDVPRHLYHFTPYAMEKLIKRHNMKVESHKPMWFDSFYISMLSSKYKSGKTNLVAAVWNGFISNIAALVNVKKCSSVIYIISR